MLPQTEGEASSCSETLPDQIAAISSVCKQSIGLFPRDRTMESARTRDYEKDDELR